jgi:hypothetical protein
MSTDKACSFLRELQEREYAAIGSQPPIYTKEAVLQKYDRQTNALRPGGEFEQELRQSQLPSSVIEAMLKQLRQAHEQTGRASYELVAKSFDLRPTPYEEPSCFAILHRVNQSLSPVDVAHPEFKLAELMNRVVIGTLPTTQFNASAIAVPGTDQFLIVFDPVFLDFIDMLSQAVAPALRLFDAKTNAEHEARIKEFLNREPFFLDRFKSVLIWFLLKGRSPLEARVDQQDEFLVERLRTEATTFALAHEYGHILLKHLQQPAVGAPNARGWLRVFGYQQEHSADMIGSTMLLAVMEAQKAPLSTCYLGANFFLLATMFIEAAREVLLSGTPRPLLPPAEEVVGKGPWGLWHAQGNLDATHPRPFHRWAVLYGWMKQMYPPDVFIQIDRDARYLFDAAEVLWELAAPVFLQAHADGTQPVREWRGYGLWEDVPQKQLR